MSPRCDAPNRSAHGAQARRSPRTRRLAGALGLILLHGCPGNPAVSWLNDGPPPALQQSPELRRVDFETWRPGPLGSIVSGLWIEFPGSPGAVVLAAETFTPRGAFSRVIDPDRHQLPATRGPHILSPGGARLGPGPDAAVEHDSLRLRFDPPCRSLWIDLLLQSLDGSANVTVHAELQDGTRIERELEVPDASRGGFATSGAFTLGLRSQDSPLVMLEIHEHDSDAKFADANIGYDNLRWLPER